MSMNLGEINIVDPVLSTMARGYKNARFIGNELFPMVPVNSRAFKRIEFNAEHFVLEDTQRAYGTNIPRSDIGYRGLPVELEQHARKAFAPVEHVDQAMTVPGIDLMARKVASVQSKIGLSLEVAQANLSRNLALYPVENKIVLAGAAKFTHPDSDPLAIVEDGKEASRAKTAMRPNTGVMGPSVLKACRKNESIRAHFKLTTSRTVTMDMLREYFALENLFVGDAVMRAGGVMQDVWGDDFILAYVPPPAERDMEVAAYGWTYQLRGHPIVTPTAWEKDNRSWESDVIDEWTPQMVGPDAGYLIKAAV